MQVVWHGEDPVTVRHVTFAPGVAVVLDETCSRDRSLAEKVLRLPGFDEIDSAAEEKAALTAELEAMGVEVDGRWGIATLKAKINGDHA